jgi:hypothetical protein
MADRGFEATPIKMRIIMRPDVTLWKRRFATGPKIVPQNSQLKRYGTGDER